MLILLPFENKVTLKHLPIVVTLLILANLMVFFLLQRDDSKHHQEAVSYYFNSGLAQIELPQYLSYLGPQVSKKIPEEILDGLGEDVRAQLQLYSIMRQDGEFDKLLRTGMIIKKEAVNYQQWQQLSSSYFRMLSQDLTYSYGFMPGKPHFINAASSLFLHANLSHILGNMLFLVIVGISVEAILGALVFLLCYMICGIGAAYIYAVLEPYSLLPLIGASGAVSGIFGLYAVLYGMRKIRFFYNILFFFNFIKAPAMILLPVWVGWEFYQFLSDPGSSVAYFSHIGGLVIGASLGFVIKAIHPGVSSRYLFDSAKENEFEIRFQQVLTLIADLKFVEALPLLRELHDEYPGNRQVLFQLYNVSRYIPQEPAYPIVLQEIFAVDKEQPEALTLARLAYRDYKDKGRPQLGIKDEVFIKLAGHLRRADHLEDARDILLWLNQINPLSEEIANQLVLLAKKLLDRGNKSHAEEIVEMILNSFKGTAAYKYAMELYNK